jgi:diacylglycerol kinase (ATP)
MRVTLLYNPKAGDGRHSRKDLVKALEKAGHDAICRSIKQKGWKRALKKPADAIVVAGGDGAIAKVAPALIGREVPLAILPLGTANNLARSLGFFASTKEIIAQLGDGNKRVFDIGVVRGPWGKKRFLFEGAGAGLLADYVHAENNEAKKNKEEEPKKLSKEQELRRHVARLREKLQNYRARKWQLELDNQDISGRYILWEAMNIRSVGPALYLAPRAATEDGRFDFVYVREQDRDLLLKYFDARLTGQKTKFPLPIRRFKKLKIVWQKWMIHLDDETWPQRDEKPKNPVNIKIKVKASALQVLGPEQQRTGQDDSDPRSLDREINTLRPIPSAQAIQVRD